MERQKDQMVGLDGCFASTCVPNFTSALLYQCLTLPAPYCCVFAIEFLRRKRVPHASDAHLERRDDIRAAQRDLLATRHDAMEVELSRDDAGPVRLPELGDHKLDAAPLSHAEPAADAPLARQLQRVPHLQPSVQGSTSGIYSRLFLIESLRCKTRTCNQRFGLLEME